MADISGNSSFFGGGSESFNAIRIKIFSPEEIREVAYGEVLNGETINYRTGLPEVNGLFCAKIFGCVKDYECLCGKYRGIKYRGIVCEKCNVEITSSKVRRRRMGYIELASPVAHIWFLKSLPSRICQLLDMTVKNVEKVLYFDAHIVIDPGLTDMACYDLLTQSQYDKAIAEYGEGSFTAMIGAEAIQKLLKDLDLEKLKVELQDLIASTTSSLRVKKYRKRLKLVVDFLSSGNDPSNMILNVIPVTPPDLRPLVLLEGGRLATSDMNALYRLVINRSNRLRNLMMICSPELIIRNEKRMLQEAVDALFDNGRRNKVVKNTSNKRPYKSLSDMLKGKQGRFRQNLLGKRVDYSGRSVIIVGPNLKLHQCGLPKRIALEMFKPFIYSKLIMYGIALTVKTAKRMLQNERPEVWDILEEVIHQHPVLLNRAPTLHRMSIQAFEPLLIEGKAIQLHPLVCTAFNADFDGDQMAVHLPLSLEAQIEARVLMMSDRNILNPANGKPIITPSKDIVLGIYYLTIVDKDEDVGHEKLFSSLEEVQHAVDVGCLRLHDKIRCAVDLYKENANHFSIIDTTPGRLKIFEIVPRGLDLSYFNKTLTVKDISDLVDAIYKQFGRRETVYFCDKLMRLGFKYAMLSGISFGKDDMVIPDEKGSLVNTAKQKVASYEQQYQEGFITKNELHHKTVDAWQDCTEKVGIAMQKGLSKCTKVSDMTSIYMMADSGARGSVAQIRQLAGMRGLMATPSGEIIPNPIVSNLREGQNGMEYFLSTHGARKGLADIALKTANSGYLTRRLVDVAQDTIINIDDCGTENSMIARALVDGSNVIASLKEYIVGRSSAVQIIDPSTQEVIVEKGDFITNQQADVIESLGIDAIKIRSILTCSSRYGLCAKCYGYDLSTGDVISTGEAVGVIAAQSIGEPGTQLTMRTFHVGGAATRRVEKSGLNAFCSGSIHFENLAYILNKEGHYIVNSRTLEAVIVDNIGGKHAQGRIPYGARLYFIEDDKVKIGDKIADWDPYTRPIISEVSGYVAYRDLIENISYSEVLDEDSGIINKIVTEWKQGAETSQLRPRIEIVDDKGNVLKLSNGADASYMLPIKSFINVSDGQKVHVADIIVKISKGSSTTRDITGGLPKVAELFEARKPKENAIISEINGYVEFGGDYYKTKRRIIVRNDDDSGITREYLVLKGRYITVNEGDYVRKGDYLTEGDPDPHDILRILGVSEFSDYMISSIQRIYRAQGVRINSKHFEVILRKMLSKVEIIDSGDTNFISGQKVDLYEVMSTNFAISREGKESAKYTRILLGITRASLQTGSFMSEVSFQDGSRILKDASIAGRTDYLLGLKENVIVGRLLPMGTGFVEYQILKKSRRRMMSATRENKE
ncbi:MAG: DNA-directed RNA polymerase, beta' subunit [Candidatus Xenolissoclinum pacificiensis L6]|uniref:DNA-directed RNA polymerase subunit beta' n=1 Tax=Candidatus Xenolissoclinum pacificiensis L6 TaxID=1401685 RepID=W2UYI5_9RICK|nr:MAG: DNA-directed RNA polymerase, beta' subunit [Candidatus Xenolissoclinum pacificiensis L6]